MEVLIRHKPAFGFHLLLYVLTGIFVTGASYYHLELSGGKDMWMYAVHFLLIQLSVWGIFYFLSLHKILFYGLLLPIFTISALFGFWTYTQDVSPSPAVIQIVMETKPDIAVDMLNYGLILYALALAAAVFLLIKKYRKMPPQALLSPFTLAALIGVSIFYIMEKKRCCTFKRRLPYNIYYSAVEYFKKPPVELMPVSENISAKTTDKPDIIFVLGESVRADHLQLNQYARPTTPLLAQRKHLVSFSGIFTPHTYTAASVPRILSDASIHDSIIHRVTSIYSVMKRLGYHTSWIGNQSPEKSYEAFINDNDDICLIDKLHSSVSFKKFKDEKLLQVFDTVYRPGTHQFITLHMIGSHWYYDIRYPERYRKFTPVTKSKYIPSNSPEEMLNSYDNTILYLDALMDALIRKIDLPQRDVLLIYLSDHGELLGEHGRWLHAQEIPEGTHPAMFVWYSETFARKHPEAVSALNRNKDTAYSTDIFYHSLLDLLQVQDMEYDKGQSIFR